MSHLVCADAAVERPAASNNPANARTDFVIVPSLQAWTASMGLSDAPWQERSGCWLAAVRAQRGGHCRRLWSCSAKGRRSNAGRAKAPSRLVLPAAERHRGLTGAMAKTNSPRLWDFWIDRGGTFTDVVG